MNNPANWLARYTKFLVLVTFLLIVAGGLVTSTQSGLSVPDWPLSYGQWMPPMVGGVRYEHTHRIIASLVGFMTLVQSIWLGFSEKRRWVRWLGIAAFGAVVLQGILGGLTVLYLLPASISIFHACLAQTFFALATGLAYVTSREWLSFGPVAFRAEPRGMKPSLVLLIVLIYLQLILGATVRHTANHFVLISHVISGFLVLIMAVLTMKRILRITDEAKLVYPALFLGFIMLVQTTFGIGAFIYTVVLSETIQPQAGKVFFVTAHQTLGALLLATSVFLFLRVYRRGSIV